MIKNVKILICDDSMTVRKKLQNAIVIDNNIKFLEAKNGKEAIDIYIQEKPDITFMDILMPEIDGLEALKEIITYDKEAKVIMLSSLGTKDNLKTALSFGAIDFIQKPWDIDNLNIILSKYIKG